MAPRRSYRPAFDALEDRPVPTVGSVGMAFPVNTLAAGNHTQSDNASNASGWHVAAWVRFYGSTNQSIRAQVFNAAGQKVGTEIVVNSSAAQRGAPAVAVAGRGNFEIVWLENNTVKGERFSAYGKPLGNAFTIGAANTNPDQRDFRYLAPDVAADNAGNFVATYSDTFDNGQVGFGVLLAKLYGADGLFQKTIIVAQGAGDYDVPVASSVGRTLDGTFTVGYVSQSLGGSGFDYYVNAKRFAPSGVLLNQPIANNYLGQSGTAPFRPGITAVMDNHGNAAVVYQGFTSIQASFINSAGTAAAPVAIAAGSYNDAVLDRDNGHLLVAYTTRTITSANPILNLTEYAPTGPTFGTLGFGTPQSQAALSTGKGHSFFVTYTNGRTNRPTAQIGGRFGTFSS